MHLYKKLTVLKNLERDAVLNRYFSFLSDASEENYASFLNELYLADAQDDFSKYVVRLALKDENPFSIRCAYADQTPSPFVVKAFQKDLGVLYDLLKENAQDENYCTDLAYFDRSELFIKEENGEFSTQPFVDFYRKNSYGKFIGTKAFRFDKGELLPIYTPPTVCLENLKNYKDEKALIENNILSFLGDLPYSDMLLYGERGTGKSSTVHAMLNKYAPEGLRLVELSKENMLSLTKLKEKLSSLPLKFLVFIDDLSLSGGDERISSLKASLEGSAEGNANNVMIVATSNRRHIVDEKFSDREDSVHAGDSMQEELSLSDRFGLSILFTTTTKPQYLSIVDQLADDDGIAMDREKLNSLAERWAIQKGGRSPRRARQFIDLVYACEKKNIPVTF